MNEENPTLCVVRIPEFHVTVRSLARHLGVSEIACAKDVERVTGRYPSSLSSRMTWELVQDVCRLHGMVAEDAAPTVYPELTQADRASLVALLEELGQGDARVPDAVRKLSPVPRL